MPDVSTVHFDVALTNVSIAYKNGAFIAPQIAPEVSVRHQSDRYFIYDPQRDALRQTFDGRAPGAAATEVDFALSSDSYYCDDHALASVLPDEERANADTPLQPQVDRTEFLSDKIMLNEEINLATLLRDPSEVSATDATTAGERWDDADADPGLHVDAAREAILAETQQLPNTVVLSWPAYQAARRNPKMLARIPHSSAGILTTQLLAELFDVERVLVARGVKNTTNPGQAPSLEWIWGTDALVMYVPPRASLKCVAPVLTFVWAQAVGSSRGRSVQTWRDETRKATMLRVQKYYDQKLVAPAAAYLLQRVAPET